jgi:hypothetical protein
MAYGNVVIDHNLVLKDPDDYEDNFVKFDRTNFAFDLHPTGKSDARGEGAGAGAPATDIEGKPRKGAIDIGAFAYKDD